MVLIFIQINMLVTQAFHSDQISLLHHIIKINISEGITVFRITLEHNYGSGHECTFRNAQAQDTDKNRISSGVSPRSFKEM